MAIAATDVHAVCSRTEVGVMAWVRSVGAVVLFAAGCDDTLFGVPIGGDDSGVIPTYDVSFEGVEAMWAAECHHCHPAVDPFDLDMLVEDIQAGTGQFIVPGDPSASMFWRLIAGERLDGDPLTMPMGTPGLRPADREHVRLWILDGAPVPTSEGGE
jgi:hypothetical protein